MVGIESRWIRTQRHPLQSTNLFRVRRLANLLRSTPQVHVNRRCHLSRQRLKADQVLGQRTLGGWECPEIFDTLKLSRRLLPEAHSYKLGGLVAAFKLAENLPDGLMPHRAIYDALVTARLFVRLATLPDTRPLTLEELRSKPRGSEDDTAALF
jgi:DNA polymerase III epsilon subunit-like protein